MEKPLFNFNDSDSKLSIYLGLICVLIAIVPMTMLYLAVNSQAKNTLSDVLFQDLKEKSFLIKRDVERFYIQKMIDIRNLSQADVLETDNLIAINQYMQEITKNSTSYIDVEVISLDGIILSNASEFSENGMSVFDVHKSNVSLIQKAFKGKQGDILISPPTELDSGDLGVIIITPVTDDSNIEVIKLLLAEVSLLPVKDLLEETGSNNQEVNHEVSLINSNGLVVASTNSHLQLLELHPDFSSGLLDKILSEEHLIGSSFYQGPSNEKMILGFSTLSYKDISPNLNWSVVVAVSYEKILVPAKKLATILFWVALVIAIIVFGLMFLVSRKIVSTIWISANFDSITGLPRRRLFVDRLLRSIQLSRRENNSSALLYIDLDRFKEINDSLGHDVGDKLLIETAKRLSLLVRGSDSVSRIGGDEFSIILGALKDPIKIDKVATSVITSLNNPFYIDDNTLFISSSIGVAIYPQDGEDVKTLIKSADQALYKSKNDGRNRYTFFTSDMQERSDKRHRISNDLRTAIPNNEFEVYYQPIVNLESGEIFKAEALIRWNHPELGFISPVEFISIAEETNFITELGDWVFSEVVKMISQVKAENNIDLNISINLSPMQFKSKNLLVDWLEQLNKNGLSGENITIEITEGILIIDDPNINNQLSQFKNAGITIALDDFGTGYSSLAYLRKFPIDILKIDKAFIDEIERNGDDLALCNAIIVMSGIFGIKVVAEGVETEGQLNLLLNMDIDCYQGYFFSKPLAHGRFINYLRSMKL